MLLNVVRRSEGIAELADALEQSEVRPTKPSVFSVKSTEFQSR